MRFGMLREGFWKVEKRREVRMREWLQLMKRYRGSMRRRRAGLLLRTSSRLRTGDIPWASPSANLHQRILNTAPRPPRSNHSHSAHQCTSHPLPPTSCPHPAPPLLSREFWTADYSTYTTLPSPNLPHDLPLPLRLLRQSVTTSYDALRGDPGYSAQ